MNHVAGQAPNYKNEWNIFTQYGYDPIGSRVAVTDTVGRVTPNQYDALDRVKSVTSNYVQMAPAD